MSRAVWKWPIPLGVGFEVEMPHAAEILTAQTQYANTRGERGALWALVDPDAATEKRRFIIVGTGAKEVPEDTRYVGSVQLTNGSLVLHVFEVTA